MAELSLTERVRGTALARVTRAAATALGLQIRRHSAWNSAELRRARLLSSGKVAVILDIGANAGQYATRLRRSGYSGRIISFEPLPDAAESCRRLAASDPNWQVREVGFAEASGTRTLHVSGSSASSSILPMRSRHTDIAPASAYVGEVEIEVTTVDEIVDELGLERATLGLKIDTQGYEELILAGASRTLAEACFVEVELLLEPLYEGQHAVDHVISTLYDHGLSLASTDPGYVDEQTGQVSWVDGIFIRRASPG